MQVVDQLHQLSSLTKVGSSGYGGNKPSHRGGSEMQGMASRQARLRQEQHFQQQAPATTAQLMSQQLSPSHFY